MNAPEEQSNRSKLGDVSIPERIAHWRASGLASFAQVRPGLPVWQAFLRSESNFRAPAGRESSFKWVEIGFEN